MSYKVEYRQFGTTTFTRVVCTKGEFTIPSSEKALCPVVEYDLDGSYRILGAREILQELKPHPYKANGGDFTRDRLDDLEVSRLYKHLENFPTLDCEVETGKPHPISEKLYSQTVFLRPTVAVQKCLSRASFLEQLELQALLLETLAANLKKDGVELDLYAVPKKKVGALCYTAGDDGYCELAKELNFGFHKAIPLDRVMREASGIRSAKRLLATEHGDFKVEGYLKPFVTTLRVAAVGYKHPALDAGELFASGLEKLKAVHKRRRTVTDLNTVPNDELSLGLVSDKGGIGLVHEYEEVYDERVSFPGGLKLVLPGGVKFIAQPREEQAMVGSKTVDLMLDIKTLASKGAIALPFMQYFATIPEELTLDYCYENFDSLEKSTIEWNGTQFTGYVFEVPVFRSNQHYSSLAKATSVSEDLISKALLKKEYTVSSRLEQAYQELKEFRNALIKEITNNG